PRCTRLRPLTRSSPGTAAARPDRRASPNTRGDCRVARRAPASPPPAPSGAATRRAGSPAGASPTLSRFLAVRATPRVCGDWLGLLRLQILLRKPLLTVSHCLHSVKGLHVEVGATEEKAPQRNSLWGSRDHECSRRINRAFDADRLP